MWQGTRRFRSQMTHHGVRVDTKGGRLAVLRKAWVSPGCDRSFCVTQAAGLFPGVRWDNDSRPLPRRKMGIKSIIPAVTGFYRDLFSLRGEKVQTSASLVQESPPGRAAVRAQT